VKPSYWQHPVVSLGRAKRASIPVLGTGTRLTEVMITEWINVEWPIRISSFIEQRPLRMDAAGMMCGRETMRLKGWKVQCGSSWIQK
jgi:hypothetical protein